ncbi:MAG: hypothetical protein VZQ47_08315 [Treponema sp.]|nr:hypothetical protein [Treponema sp.]MEE3435546.1 hypothetical protein [Treponema sp.]
MKKKTKLSSSQADAVAFERFHLSKNSLFVPFIVTVLFCLFGAAANIWLFCRSYFMAMSRLDQTPIATITFKYKAAQRKFIDRNLWTRLVQNSPVYNGDTLHTGELSEATVHFTDGNELELSQNTMAQVFLHEDQSFGAELTEGSAVIDSSGAENGMSFSVGGTSVEIQQGASVAAEIAGDAGQGGGVALRLLNGSASVEGAALSQEDAVILGQNGSVKALPLSVKSPRPDQKFLFHEGKATPVKFSWKSVRLEEDEDLLLEICDKKDFAEPARRIYANGLNDLTVDLEGGAWYWRLQSVNKGTTVVRNRERAASGRLQALYSPAPDLITPVNDYVYYYRTRNPSVRLIWSDSQYATSYLLEISKRQDLKQPVVSQRSATTSSIISTLSAGTYYWRVTPFFTVNKVGLAAPSQAREFTIERRGELNAPQLLSPAANGSVDISTEVGPAHFSWKNENEAASYRVKIFREGRASNPLINQVTSKNFLEVLPANVSLGEGKWYWSVAQIDDEGNESKASEERMFYAQRGKLFVRTIEPQEGYRVANTFAADMKFTWKQNLPGDFVNTLQVSTSPNFTTLVYQARVVGNSASSIAFAESRYYWRIHSKNDAGMILDTQPKSFEVLPQLDAPTVLAPLGRAVVHPDSPYAFKWQDVDGADFYKLAIYRQSDGELVYEDNLYQLGVEIPMYDAPGFTDRSVYRYELQARANAVEGKGSRRNGRLAEGNFLLVKIRPVEVVSPARDSVIEGVDAVMKPLSVRWSSVEEPAKSQLVISKVDGKDRTPLLTYPAGVSFEQGRPKIPYSMSIELPDTFDAGNYELVVYAQTSDGYDISNTDAKNIGRFRITPVAPLNSIGSLSVTPRTMNAEYLMVETNPRNFTFAWSPVKDATHYLVQVNDKRGKPILPRIEVSAKETSYKFDFLAVEDEKIKEKLMNGTFQAAVQAVRKIDTNKDGKVDKILQRSPVKTQNFSVDVGDPKKARGKKGAKNPYGL